MHTVGYDGSQLAERIIDPAVALGVGFLTDFLLVMVLDAIEDPAAAARIGRPDLPPEDQLRRARRALGQVAAAPGRLVRAAARPA